MLIIIHKSSKHASKATSFVDKARRYLDKTRKIKRNYVAEKTLNYRVLTQNYRN